MMQRSSTCSSNMCGKNSLALWLKFLPKIYMCLVTPGTKLGAGKYKDQKVQNKVEPGLASSTNALGKHKEEIKQEAVNNP